MKRVALLVLNYNCKPFIKYCLDSLLNQNYKNKVIYFIDNNSLDGSPFFVKENYPQIKLIVNKRNVGIGKAFNDVIKKIINQFDYIAMFNTDVLVDNNWLKELVSTFNKDPSIEEGCGLTLNWQGNLVDNAGGTIINLFFGIIGGFLGYQDIKKLPQKYKYKSVKVFFGIITGMFVRTSVFKRVGFFDEDYFMFCEDFDFGWRVLLSGGKIVCNPKAVMYHYSHYALRNKKIVPKIIKLTETNLMATYFKNLSAIGLLIIFPVLVILRFLMAIIYLAISPKITFLKIAGISLFFKNFFSGRYNQNRKLNLKIRKLSDKQVFMRNPASLFDIKTMFKLAPSWFKSVYNDSKIS